MQTLAQSLNELTGKNVNSHEWSGAVNFLLLDNEVLFIRRSEQVPSHKGQIAFMGGHKLDGEDSFSCAKREFVEESGISEKYLDTLGLIWPVTTSQGSLIVPVVSKVKLSKEAFFENAKSNGEWDILISVPLDYLKNSKNWVCASWQSSPINIGSILFCPLPIGTYQTNTNHLEDLMLWGATAKMVWNYFNG